MATHSVPDVLGGELVLGRAVNQGGALAELVREGLPVKALLLLAERLDIRQAEISEKIGIPKRTLTRRLAQHSRLTAIESDRAVRLAQDAEPGVARRASAGPARHRSGRARG